MHSHPNKKKQNDQKNTQRKLADVIYDSRDRLVAHINKRNNIPAHIKKCMHTGLSVTDYSFKGHKYTLVCENCNVKMEFECDYHRTTWGMDDNEEYLNGHRITKTDITFPPRTNLQKKGNEIPMAFGLL